MKKIILVLVCLMMACSLGYQAQAQSNYVCLDTPSPYTTANSAWLMSNGGSGIYSLTTTIATQGSHKWWLLSISASTTIAVPPNVPSSWSWILTTTVNQQVTFYANFNKDATWSPESTHIYTTANVSTTSAFGFNGGPRYVAVGIDTWFGDTSDNDYLQTYPSTSAKLLMHDDGLNGDKVAGDGIYSVQVPMSNYALTTSETRSYRVVSNYNTSSATLETIGCDVNSQTNWGFAYKGSTLPITVVFSSDTILLECDTLQGRIRATHSGSSSAPWYALGDLSGLIPSDTVNRMYDDGTHGDPTAGDGKYSITVNATFSTNTHWVNVINEFNQRHPSDASNSGSWFAGTTGQNVVITFDTNTYTDGFLPYTNFAYTTDTSTIGAHVYCVVGDLSTFFGYGTINFDLHSVYTAAYNASPLYFDQSAGDSIFTFQNVVVPAVTTTSQMRWKWTLDDVYTQQIGANGRSMGNPPNNLINAIGGDTILFEVDVVSGRIKATNLTHAGYAVPVVSGTNGQPGHVVTFTASGGTPPYLVWNSSNTTAIQILGFSGNTATVSLANYGTSTVTVQDSYGQQGVGVFSVVATSAPLAPESESFDENRNTVLWHINE